MNKNIRRIVSMTLVIAAVSVVAPNTSTNLLMTRAYASTNESGLESLALLDESGNPIKIYDSDMYDKRVHNKDIDDGEVYYAKTSASNVSIDIEGPSKKYVRIFKGTTDSTQGKKVGEDIKLSHSSQTTLIAIKIYGEEPEENVAYDNNNYDTKGTYKIRVRYSGDSSASNSGSDTTGYSSSGQLTAADYDKIYLDRMSVDGNAIDLLNSKVDYTYNVDSDVAQVNIKAVPEDKETDDVEIDNTDVDNSDNYKKTVDLKKGENKFKIDLTNDEGDDRVYTLTINRGAVATTAATSQGTSNPSTTTDTNKWVQVNGQWQYKDAAGNSVKNSWIQNYYLDQNGNMATGWLTYNGSWYYLGTDGAAKTGWQLINGSWYYLNNNGSWNTTGN